MENTVFREGEVYGVLRGNGINIEMLYLFILFEGVIKLWMREMEGCTMEMVDGAI
jgi:hypothetical protein